MDAEIRCSSYTQRGTKAPTEWGVQDPPRQHRCTVGALAQSERAERLHVSDRNICRRRQFAAFG